MADKRFPYWTQADTAKLRELLIAGTHSWEDLEAEFPRRTTVAIQCKAGFMKVRNMYYVLLSRSSDDKPRPYYKPQLPADVMVKPAAGELYHANGRRVNYA
jgi:hypothetical protein